MNATFSKLFLWLNISPRCFFLNILLAIGAAFTLGYFEGPEMIYLCWAIFLPSLQIAFAESRLKSTDRLQRRFLGTGISFVCLLVGYSIASILRIVER
jgi:hypothetical protein